MAPEPAVDMRGATRYAVQWSVAFEHGSGITRNLSASGACIDSGDRFDPGELLQFAVQLPDRCIGPSRLVCHGRVTRVLVRDSRSVVGISFDSLEFVY